MFIVKKNKPFVWVTDTVAIIKYAAEILTRKSGSRVKYPIRRILKMLKNKIFLVQGLYATKPMF